MFGEASRVLPGQLTTSTIGREVRQPVSPLIPEIVGELGAPHLSSSRQKPEQSLGPHDRIYKVGIHRDTRASSSL
jgi:hypothetical protein